MLGHTNTITDISWAARDQFFYTCGQDGLVYEWSLADNEFSRNEFPRHNCKFQAITATEIHDANGSKGASSVKVFYAGTEHNSNIILERAAPDSIKDNQVEENKKVTSLCILTSLYNVQALLAGTDDGNIIIYSTKVENKSYDTLSSHLGEVTKIVAAPNGRFVFSVGVDGCLMIYSVTDFKDNVKMMANDGDKFENIENNAEYNQKALSLDEMLADVVLINKSEIEDYKTTEQKLQTEMEDLKNQMESRAAEDRERLEKEKNKAEDKMKLEIEAMHRRYEELRVQKSQIEKESANLLKAVEANNLKAVEEIEAIYEKKLTYENEKYLLLEQELLEERMVNENRFKKMEDQNQEIIDRLQNEFKESFNRAQQIYETTKQSADE